MEVILFILLVGGELFIISGKIVAFPLALAKFIEFNSFILGLNEFEKSIKNTLFDGEYSLPCCSPPKTITLSFLII